MWEKVEMIDQEASEKIYSEEKLDTSTYKCPNCGGESEFSAKTKNEMSILRKFV